MGAGAGAGVGWNVGVCTLDWRGDSVKRGAGAGVGLNVGVCTLICVATRRHFTTSFYRLGLGLGLGLGLTVLPPPAGSRLLRKTGMWLVHSEHMAGPRHRRRLGISEHTPCRPSMYIHVHVQGDSESWNTHTHVHGCTSRKDGWRERESRREGQPNGWREKERAGGRRHSRRLRG